MNAQIFEELINVLEQETRVYDDILKIAKNKTNIIVEGKVSDLESIVKLEQSLILQMSRLENIREGLVEKISIQVNIKPSDITITELVKYMEKTQADRLMHCQNKLTGTIDELKNSNDLNSKLIKNSLEFISFSVNLLAGAGDLNNGYGSSGQTSDSKKRSLFDVKL